MSFKRVLLLIVLCVALLSFENVSLANTPITAEQATTQELLELVNRLLTTHYDSQVSSNYIGSDAIMEDNNNTYLWKRFSELQTKECQILHKGMHKYNYTIKTHDLKIKDDRAWMTVVFDIVYYYNYNPDHAISSYDHTYKFIFVKTNHQWLIGRVDSNEDFYELFNQTIEDKLPSPVLGNDYRQTVDLVFQSRIDNTTRIRKIINEQKEQEKYRLKNQKSEVSPEATPLQTLENDLTAKGGRYKYNYAQAVMYARAYTLGKIDNNLFYNYGTKNCTNFVSQCIWAGYGGCSYPFPQETLQKNMVNQVRMVPGEWAANATGALANWCNVKDFYNYVTKTKTYGPRATCDNDQKPWNSVYA